jgi:hypothetical protein
MSKAQNIVDVLTEEGFDASAPQPSSAGAGEPQDKYAGLYKHWDEIHSKFLQLQALRRKADATWDELRCTVELSRELARYGKKREDVKQFIVGEQLHYVGTGPYAKGKAALAAKGYGLRSTYRTPAAGQMTILPTDYVGAEFNDDSVVWFDKPIKPFTRHKEESSEKASPTPAPEV